MAVKKTPPTASVAAWRKFAKTARQYREATGDDELRALLLIRVRNAFEEWATAEEAGK